MASIKKLSVVTKSFDGGVYSKLPMQHAEQQIIKAQREKLRRIGDGFSEAFASSFGHLEVEHVSLDDFLLRELSVDEDNGHLVCTIGGDGSYLLAAHKIKTSNAFSLAINPDPGSSIGKLSGFSFNQKHNVSEVAQAVTQAMTLGNFEIIDRTRIEVLNLSSPEKEYPLGTLGSSALNEAFITNPLYNKRFRYHFKETASWLLLWQENVSRRSPPPV